MAITVHELYRGRRPTDGDRAADEIPYLAVCDDGETEDEARAAIRAEAPATLTQSGQGTLNLKTVRVLQPLRIADAGGNTFYEGVAEYESSDNDHDTGESSFSFDTTGGTFKITQSKETVQRKKAGGGTAPDLQGTINGTADGVEGVDVTIPQYGFTETHWVADADVTDTYKGLLYSLTGRTNNAGFKGCAAGECLFLGARGQKRGRGDWEITFAFAAEPNVTGLQIGDITGINKKGWEYLWVRYQPTTVGTGADTILAQKPQYVYVERVYEAGDFSQLDIGT